MVQKKIEFYVGVFIIAGCLCFFWLFTALGGADWNRSDKYPIFGFFTSVSGLKVGAEVEMAGVEIGRVKSIILDTTRYVAKVELSLNKEVELSDDTIASVKTSGIIGDKYINLSAGGSEDMLAAGDIIYNTESSIDIESLISKYIFQKDSK
ncbi:outer membrane lipid asymmetry maintenance protein MlaD [Desulfotalea psychrophila]|nr:outer membrane lipid asymmetry maintenance protein MlaD [Desulfotalea psychrophila]